MTFTTAPAAQMDTCLPSPTERNGTALVMLPGGSSSTLPKGEALGYADWLATQWLCGFLPT